MDIFGAAVVICVVVTVLALGDVFAVVFDVKSVEAQLRNPHPYSPCPVCKSIKHTVHGSKVMVVIQVEVLVCMCGFTCVLL